MFNSKLYRKGRPASLLVLALAIPLAACGQGSGTGVETRVVQLDAEGTGVLSAEMADCVRQTGDVEITDDFLVIGERIPLDMEVLPPELAEALVACIAQADGVPDVSADGTG